VLIAVSAGGTAYAKNDGILKMYIWDNPPSVSMPRQTLAQRATMVFQQSDDLPTSM
jgi:hypothetical protein